MKKSLIATAVAVLLLGAGASPALATGELPPSGEEYWVSLTVPSAPGGCATSLADVTGADDLYANYGGASELVATWSVVEDAKGFLFTATLVSKYYSLNNPLNPGRVTSATFSVPRCPLGPIVPAPEVPSAPPVVVDPVTPVPVPAAPAPVVPVEPVVTAPTGPAVPAGPVVAAPVPVPAPAVSPVAAPAPLAVPAVTPAPVVAAPEVLANTGAREDLLFLLGGVALALLLVGGAAVVAARKS